MSLPSLLTPNSATGAVHTPETDLTQAFASFERSAAHMVRAYRELEVRAAAVDAELDTTNSTLRGVLESMPSGLVTRDSQGVVTLINRAAESILGFSESVLRTEFPRLCDVEGCPLAAPTGERETAQRVYSRPDGATRNLLWTCTLTPSGGSLSLFSDVTELKRLQDQIAARERLASLGETAASLTHQVRNPLHVMRGFLSLLQREFEDDPVSPRATRYLARVSAGADALERVVGGFLGLAREEPLDRALVGAGEVARRALASLSPSRGPQATVTLEVLHEGELSVDSLHVEQALVNLLENAREANPGGPVHMHVSAQGSCVAFVVEDQGPGIPAELMPRLFQAFVSTKETGSGLGLAYARKIAALHGGTLRAENRAQSGARFVLELPAAVDAASSTRKVG